MVQWTIDSYALVIACLLMFSGSLADRFERRRVFQIGLAIFSAGSLLCSVAPSLAALVAFRGFQAVGASMLGPVAMSIVATIFTKPAARARAVGAWEAVGGLSVASGPVLGGLLVSGLGWRSVFWVNVPIGVLAIYLAAKIRVRAAMDCCSAAQPVRELRGRGDAPAGPRLPPENPNLRLTIADKR